MRDHITLLNGFLVTLLLLIAIAANIKLWRSVRDRERTHDADRLAQGRWQRAMNRDIRLRGGEIGEYEGVAPEIAERLKAEPEDAKGLRMDPPPPSLMLIPREREEGYRDA